MSEKSDYVVPNMELFVVIFDAWRQNNRDGSREIGTWLDAFLPSLMSSEELWLDIVGFLAYQIQNLENKDLERLYGEKKAWMIRRYGVLNTYSDGDIRIPDLISTIKIFCSDFSDQSTGNRPLVTYLEANNFFESAFNRIRR